jgi:hypothetical protein
MILRLCELIQEMPSSIAIRESIWTYPIVETVHVLSLCLFLGFVVMMDLRLVSATLRRAPFTEVQRRFFPWQMTGFALMVGSGVVLFFTEPLRFYGNVFFRVKLLLLVVAGLNAMAFHFTIFRRVAEWDVNPVTPLRARLAGGVSIVLWAAVVVCGRMIAYNWFDPLP